MRFVADNAQDDPTPFVLDTAEDPASVVLVCRTDEQAERVAAYLNREHEWARNLESPHGTGRP